MNYCFNEPREILKDLNAEDLAEMTIWQQGFLCGLIKEHKPKKIVEVGVAAGGTTAVILNALVMLNLQNTSVFSIDTSSHYYRDSQKETGYIGTQAKELLNTKEERTIQHEFMFGGDGLVDHLPRIGKDIDFLILDTMHVCPGEILDFLTCFPYLSGNAVVVLHDIILQYETTTQAFATQLLLDTVVADKIVGRDDNEKGGYPNIGAFQINGDTHKYIENVFSALTIPWGHMPTDSAIEKYRNVFQRFYEKEYVEIFDIALMLNMELEKSRLKNSNAGIAALIELIIKIDNRNCYIYGDGIVAGRLHALLESASVNVAGHVISDDQVCNSNRTIHLSDLSITPKDVLVLGVSSGLHEQIVLGIKKHNIDNYITLDKSMYSLLKVLYI